MSKIIVLQGPPGAGKSTFAEDFIKNHENYVIVSRDEIRDSLGTPWLVANERMVSEIEKHKVINAIKAGFNVIIDAPNLDPKVIAKWEDIANKKQCEIEYKQFWIPYSEAVKRDNNEDRTHNVGATIIKGFYLKYNPSLIDEEIPNRD